ncbi:HET-domain-containing protein [Xylaria scruposa]|nr:HET-domain-containing protein [Xylaria scruposa]
MRLIDVETLELQDFHSNVPRYAILSHTWADEEVTFQEYLAATAPDTKRHAYATRRAGYAKIVGACERARIDGLQYLWCDTNCINKSSSAELSEAINSMYAWYRDSEVCYAYLEDVVLDTICDEPGGSIKPGSLKDSRWFTRGWTLQELIVPNKVIFFDRMWKALGDRENLADHISRITRIHIGVLNDRNTVPEYSVAQRMSWAADRQTSRAEDIAYCLLGIFGVHMPLLYGEGLQAFTRLQEEIIKISDDQSIFAWVPHLDHQTTQTGALAIQPNDFYHCGSIVKGFNTSGTPHSLTNLGVSMELPMIQSSLDGIVIVGLNCSKEIHGSNTKSRSHVPKRHFQVWIWLQGKGHEIFLRVHIHGSITFLERLYPATAPRSIQRVFLPIKIATNVRFGNLPESGSKRSSHSGSAAGFLVTMGFGKMNARAQTYDETWSPGKFTVLTLRERGVSRSSHQIISSYAYCILLSISWDLDGKPQSWEHTSISDPTGRVTQQFAASEQWTRLLHTQPVDRAHKKVRELYDNTTRGVAGTWPLVFLDNESSQDTLGQSEVVVAIVFREPQKRTPLPEVNGLFQA